MGRKNANGCKHEGFREVRGCEPSVAMGRKNANGCKSNTVVGPHKTIPVAMANGCKRTRSMVVEMGHENRKEKQGKQQLKADCTAYK